MEYISIKDFPRDKIYVLLNKKYRESLIKKSINNLNCKNYFELAKWINKKNRTKFNGGDIKYWIEGKRIDQRTGKEHPKFMPLWLVIELIYLNKEKIESINKKIISYRSGGSGLKINNPNLPIKITPEINSIVIHLICDGAAGDFTPSYTQKDKRTLDNFIKKLENCFGEFERSIYFTQGKYQVKFPKAITDVISNYYSIKSYKSYDSKIPKRILNNKSKSHKLSCIISFLVDEAQVRDIITFFSTNNILLEQLKQLINDCGYKSSEVKFNKKAGEYHLNFKNESINNFYMDILALSKEYPTCNLSFKEHNVKFIIDRRKNKNSKKKGVTDKLIIETIKYKRLNATEISNLMGYAHVTIIHHLRKLYDQGIVKREIKDNGSYVWMINM